MILLAALLAMAGCAGHPELGARAKGASGSIAHTVAPPGAPASMAPDLGMIQGQVLSDELTPIGGANVSIIRPFVLSVAADEAGRFAFERLRPGTYALQASAVGFESQAREVDAPSGEVAEARFVMQPLAIDEPWSAPYIDNMFLSCSVVAGPVAVGACGLANAAYPVFPPEKSIVEHASEAGLLAVVASLTWSKNQALGANWMQLSIYAEPGAQEYFTNYKHGPSPLSNQTVLGQPMTAKNNIHTAAFANRFCGPSDVPRCSSNPPESVLQVVYQQRVTGYTTLFYGAPPPAGYTGVPDA